MTAPSEAPPLLLPPAKPLSPEKALRRLFLTMFLRGRTARGLRKDSAPKSLGRKLALTLFFYGVFGMFALRWIGHPVFELSLYLHAMTFVFLGMFVAASGGEVLFNKEENEVLMHRPITPKALLWAKISVLVQVSLWLAGAFNFAGLFAGVTASDGGLLYPVAHILSTCLEALFCTSCVVLVYQLCLRWFGRERLEGLMTMTQVFLAVAVVVAGQVLPRFTVGVGKPVEITMERWWIACLPPAWFAGMDDVIAGAGGLISWVIMGVGVAATALVLWLAFGRLAGDYAIGLQVLGEVPEGRPKQRARRRWLQVVVKAPPLGWLLRDSVARASFLLSAAYLFRDRDVKLRVYPGIAPMLVMPAIFLLQDHGTKVIGGFGGFGIAFAGMYMGLVPMLGLEMLRYSQQWQASDLFRIAPLPGPSPLCRGARLAVLLILTFPLLILVGLFAVVIEKDLSRILLLIPGVIALPAYALIPCLKGKAVPLSQPNQESKSVRRGMTMIVATFISMAMGGLASWAWSTGWFLWLLVFEALVVAVLYLGMRAAIANAGWPSEDATVD